MKRTAAGLKGPRVDVIFLARTVECAHQGCGREVPAGSVVCRFFGPGFDARVRCPQHENAEGDRFGLSGDEVEGECAAR